MKVAIVTGASKNIGKAIALELGRSGIGVAINGRDPTTVAATVDELRDQGIASLPIPGDVRDEQAVDKMVHDVLDAWGRIDILVNNAAMRSFGPIEDTAYDDWRVVVATVLDAAFLTTRAVLPHLRMRSWGRIVNIAGESGQAGARDRAPLVAAKSGLIGLTKATALEVASAGITANVISPGLIDTARIRMLGSRSDDAGYVRETFETIPVGRKGYPDEVAALCAFLCSDAAGFITGQVYGINGGSYL